MIDARNVAGERLSTISWIALAVALLISVGSLQWLMAPGLMSYDSLLFYEQAITGVKSSTWPPMYTYLIDAVRAAGGTYGTLFLIQAAMVFGFGGYLAMKLAGPGQGRRLVALLLFLAAFVIVPPLYGTVMVLWNVVAVASFLLAALSWQWIGFQSGRRVWAFAAAAAYAVCFALRYNSIFLELPGLLMLVVWPTGLKSSRADRVSTGAVLLLVMSLAYGSFSHHLPDLKPLPPNNGVRTIQTFDLIGVSALCGDNFLTSEMTAGRTLTPADIRARYDARHINFSYLPKDGAPPPIHKPFDFAEVNAHWWQAVKSDPGCYLFHRFGTFREQMGMNPAELFYPTHGGIDPNRFGFVLQHPQRAEAAIGWIVRNAEPMPRRPFWLYLGALIALAVLAVRRDAAVFPLLVLTLGAFAYAGSHLFITAAGDARYIFPSNVLCAVVIAAAVASGRANSFRWSLPWKQTGATA